MTATPSYAKHDRHYCLGGRHSIVLAVRPMILMMKHKINDKKFGQTTRFEDLNLKNLNSV